MAVVIATMAYSQYPWAEGVTKKEYPKLKDDIVADVAIVGGGMTGVITAYLLAREGKRVVLCEKRALGEGATYDTTAFLTEVVDTDFLDLITGWGAEAARKVVESHARAISHIEQIVHQENIECGFMRCSNFVYANTHEDLATLEKEFGALQTLGRFVKKGFDTPPGFVCVGCFEVYGQAKFHPHRFLYSLAEKVEMRGAQIFEHTEVVKFERRNSRYEVVTPEARIMTEWVVVATYEPFYRPFQLYFKKAFYTSYVAEVHIPKGSITEAIYEDTANPYHYFRVDSGDEFDALMIGGEDHRSDVPINPQKNFKALTAYIRHILDGVPHTVVKTWRGPILEPVDGLAYIGSLGDERVLYAMAFSGNGMTYACIAAEIFCDTILGKENRVRDIYSAERVPGLKKLFIKGKDYSQEMWNGAIKNFFR